MFSRAAKSVVKNLGHRKYYLNEDNIRSGIMGAADGLSQTLSPFGTGGSKFGGSTISNSKPTSHLLMLTTEQSQSRKLENPTTENRQTKCRRKNTALACFANRELDLERTITGLRTKDMNTSLESFPKKQSETSNQVGITNLPLYESKVNGRVTWVVSQLPGTKGNSESRWRQLAPSRSEGLPSYTPLSTQSRNADLWKSRVPKAASEEVNASSRKFSMKLSSDPPNRSHNDDYFPQGDDYEDEIGGNDYRKTHQSKKPTKSRGRKRSTESEDDHDNFSVTLVASSGVPLRPIIRRRCTTADDKSERRVSTNDISAKDTLASMQTLVEKVAEFKRRIFGMDECRSKMERKIDGKNGNHGEISGIDKSGHSKEERIITTATLTEKLWLGEPDCGEGPPDCPKKGPCPPPDCPCVPMKKPGYPAKPRCPRKDFCFNCPPKKPCNLNKCPPEVCDGTCGKSNVEARPKLLKLNSESQANRNHQSSTSTSIVPRFVPVEIRNVDRRTNFLRQPRRNFCTNRDDRESSKKLIESPNRPIAQKCKTDETAELPKVLYRKCPPLPKLPKLPKFPKEIAGETKKCCGKIVPPKCPPLPKLPKCPKCPKMVKKKSVKIINDTENPSKKKNVRTDVKNLKKSIWEQICERTKREMSTCRTSKIFGLREISISKISKRRISGTATTPSSFSSKDDSGTSDGHPPWKSRKCRTVEEVCGEEIDPKLKALECKTPICPKKIDDSCYPKKKRCGEVKKSKEIEKKIDVVRTKNICEKITEHCRSVAIAKEMEKMIYGTTKCETPKLLKSGPCPSLRSTVEGTETGRRCGKNVKAMKSTSLPLPGPPSGPVIFCPCPPPPKLHPGSCPCYEEIKVGPSVLIEGCSVKPKYPCPEPKVFYCPPTKNDCPKKKTCRDDDKKNRTH